MSSPETQTDLPNAPSDLRSRIRIFLKKYGFSILFYTLVLIMLLYIEPRQERFYMETETKRIEYTSWLVVGVIAAVLFFLLVVIALKRRTRPFLPAIVYPLAFLLPLCFLFHVVFMTLGLYINRLGAGTAHKRIYLITAMAGDTSKKRYLLLYDMEQKDLVMDEIIQSRLEASGLHANDTLHLNFTKGCLGFDYLNAP